MKDNPLVSVIIPSFNHKNYVLQSIKSVFDQTYKNTEIIVVDDGSTDGSVEILTSASQDLGFKFIAQENSGVCRTLNRGIREFSSGKYICVLASDDYFEPTKIAKQVAALKASGGSEFCYTQAVEFDSWTGKTLSVFPKKRFSGHVLKKIILRQPYAGGSIMFSRELYDRVNGFDECMPIEDWDFSLRCASETTFAGVHEPLLYYRSHETNSMKWMGRRKIFRAKAMILSKNYFLTSPTRWLCALVFNYFYDHSYRYIKYFDIKRIFN